MSESYCHHQQNLNHYDSTRYVDLSVVRDTIAVLRTETIWREPDSVGNIYPLITVSSESKARRQTANNITTTRIDTLYITTNTDDIATENSKTMVGPSYQARAAPALDWVRWVIVVVGGIVIICIIFRIRTP